MVVISTWICVLVIALQSLLINDYQTARKNYLSALSLGIEVLVVGFAIVACIFIGLKVHRLTGRTNIDSKILKSGSCYYGHLF